MNDIVEIAVALAKWGEKDPDTRPIIIAATRDMLCLAEAELKAGIMMRIADESAVKIDATLPELFNILRDTNRDCQEIMRSIDEMEGKHPVDNSISREIGEMAISRLTELASSADAIEKFSLANTVDSIVSKVTSSI